MSLVRSQNTRFELDILRLLSAELYPLGYRYRKHCRSLTGTPDMVFPKFKLAVFFDSDFWHGRNFARLAPKMTPVWRAKILRNMQRDRQVNRKLRRLGWSVLRFGESRIKNRPHTVVRRVKIELEKRAS